MSWGNWPEGRHASRCRLEFLQGSRSPRPRRRATAPTAQLGLVEPPAGSSSSSVPPTWVANTVTTPAGLTLSEFAVQLTDTGTGINNATVTGSQVSVFRSDKPNVPLVQGIDYFYTYDSTNHIIYLSAGPGVWAGGFTYTIVLNNSAPSGIADLAGNLLGPNQSNGTTTFSVSLVTDVIFSNAPNYSVAWHTPSSNLYLGTLAPTAQAYYTPNLTPENGITGFPSYGSASLTAGEPTTTTAGLATTLQVYVTNTTGKAAYLNVWIDYNGDNVFEADEQVVSIVPSYGITGTYTLPGVPAVPASAINGTTWIRFRLSSQSALSPSGAAPDGDVEDYQLTIKPAPATITGHVYNDLNDNGIHDSGEPGMQGWTITATGAAGTYTATSAADGSYTLSVIAPGSVRFW